MLDPRPLPAASVGFAPISSSSARILILGSLPGEVSLRRREYYAQPRNLFWRIMGELLVFSPILPYRARMDALLANEIAVWDVCAAAIRAGSLDSAINLKSVEVNDFAAFYKQHEHLALVCFNGAKAASLYRAKVMPLLRADFRGIQNLTLPSTSPAHASVPYDKKRLAWEVVRERVILSRSARNRRPINPGGARE
jgi:double-stranded uracil-DNA glycosylase